MSTSLEKEAEAIVEDVIKKVQSMGKKITLQLIIDRNLPIAAKNNKNTKIDKKLDLLSCSSSMDITTSSILKLTHIRLDRENIDEIDNLAEFLNHTGLTHLFLHYNQIRRIENLEFLTGLTYLNLSHNHITKIENLKHLRRLQLLDLSSNKIETRVEDIEVS